MTHLRIPVASYRVQFNDHFTFNQALELVDYFYELGISDLYASPIMKAQQGSIHGYDILDHGQINPEIGTEEELGRLMMALQQRDMGFILDIVPNHMCIAEAANRWWNDVLENGPSSPYAGHFNIIWNPRKRELTNKVLLPVLDQQYGKVIENQDFKVIYDEGAFFLQYKMRRFPINPRTWQVILEPVSKQMEAESGDSHPDVLELQSILTALFHLPTITETDPKKIKERQREKEIIKKRLTLLLEKMHILKAVQSSLESLNGIKGQPASFDLLEKLLDTQAYRLSYWRVANDEINYRRFFDINELASTHVEDENVFNDIHELILRFVKQKWVTGLRIDHVDGLFNPEQYFKRLQQACSQVLKEEETHLEMNKDFFYIIVEKILIGDEQLNPHWLIYGTTGYDYLNLVNGLFVVSHHQSIMQQIYERFTKSYKDMLEIIYICKKLILTVSMSSELHILGRHLAEISEQHRWSKDFTLDGLRFALKEIIACFPVYRSYIQAQENQVSDEDKYYITSAVQQAKRLNPASESSIFDFIENVLLLQDPEGLSEQQIACRRQFVLHFQQLTGPVTAKGVEDTAFYRYYPLASLNEVGMDPESFGTSIETFHRKNQEKKIKWPHTLLTTFTHDTKRSEDVRARINVLSENPKEWGEALHRWHQYNQDKKTQLNNRNVPDMNEEYLLYQTLVGTWPLYPMDASAKAQYIDRIDKYMNKALREAKTHTSWININESYEKSVQDFIHKILNLDPSHAFVQDFIQYVRPIMRAGMFNSLSQTLLKMTSPGIPDFYQGSELWEFTLVDPDNRHPVDYSNRLSLLNLLKEKAQQDRSKLVSHLIETPEDGLIKLYLTTQVLNFRRNHAQLFQHGDYVPLQLEGKKAQHVVAFSRTLGNQTILVAVGRFYTQLLDISNILPIGEKAWDGLYLSTSSHLHHKFRDILSRLEFSLEHSQPLPIATLFSKLPIVLLEKIS